MDHQNDDQFDKENEFYWRSNCDGDEYRGDPELPSHTGYETAPLGSESQLSSKHPKHIQRLLEDPNGMTSNPRTMDWTYAPFEVMKLTLDYMADLLDQVPTAVAMAIEHALIDAKRCNEASSAELVQLIDDLFFSYEKDALGRKGIFQEQVAQNYTLQKQLDLRGKSHKEMAELIKSMTNVSSDFKKAIDERWVALSTHASNIDTREVKLRQLEVALDVKKKDFESLSFWEKIRDAFEPVMQDRLGGPVVMLGGFLIAVAVVLSIVKMAVTAAF